jgi:predicted NUDIX family NTP pyrophosphohydrolase
VKQASGKVVKVWALKYDLNPDNCKSNTFELEWPLRSGRMREFPEVESWAWFSLDLAESKIIAAQREFLARLGALRNKVREGCEPRGWFYCAVILDREIAALVA